MDKTFLTWYEILILTILPFYFLVNNDSWREAWKQVAYSITEASENRYFASGIYDPKGKKIKITFNKDQTLTFSPNATADIIELANGMAKTKIGLQTLKLMNASNTKISLEIDKLNVILNTDESYIAAETYPIITIPINEYGKPIGSRSIFKAKIVIYEAAIKDMAAKNGEKILINGVDIETKHFSISDILSSFSIHEFIHILDNKSSGSLNPMATKIQLEKKPYEIQLQHFKELEEQKSVK